MRVVGSGVKRKCDRTATEISIQNYPWNNQRKRKTSYFWFPSAQNCDGSATELRRKYDRTATEMRQNCDGNATEMRQNCDGNATKCDRTATEMRRNCDGKATEMRQNCDGNATELRRKSLFKIIPGIINVSAKQVWCCVSAVCLKRYQELHICDSRR